MSAKRGERLTGFLSKYYNMYRYHPYLYDFGKDFILRKMEPYKKRMPRKASVSFCESYSPMTMTWTVLVRPRV